MASLRPSPTSSANENRSQFPENHRGTEFTEKTQSHLSSSLEPIFLNEKTRRRKATRSLTQRRRDAETQRISHVLWRGPGRPTTAGYRWARRPLRTQAFVAVSRPSDLRSASAGLAVPPFHFMIGRARLLPQSERRKAGPTRPRRVGRWGVWLRQALALGADERSTGGRRSFDRRLFRRQFTALSHHISDNLFASLRLCAFAFSIGWFGDSASPRLCASAFSSLCPPLCLRTSVVFRLDENALFWTL